MAKVIRDLSDSSGYWAAIWTMCALPDLHVICDAPIGCFNLVATAVPDYTDAVPHLENVTPSVITEQEVGGAGTAPAVRATYEGLRDAGLLEGKQLIVVSTAESEMIGSDLSDLVTTLKPGTAFYYSDSLSEDEWAGRDRVLRWLWEQFGAAQAVEIRPERGRVNIIGPTYGCFNSAADLHEVKRLIEGAGGRLNRVFPMESRLDEMGELARGELNVVLYHEFGHGLAQALGQPWLHAPIGLQATTDFVREIGRQLGTEAQAERFIRHEKQSTLQAVWDLWKGPQGDWFPTTDIGLVATRSYVDGLQRYLGDELGMPIAFTATRPAPHDGMDNEAIRRRLHEKAPAFVFGSINEKIYLSEAGARHSAFIPAAFPGPIVRRAVGTPFMGYRGAVWIVQEIVNRLYEALYNFLPLDSAYNKQAAAGPPAASGNGRKADAGSLAWQPEATALLDAALDKLPFLPRISASRELQMQVEALARAEGLSTITAELVEAALAARGAGR
ncbi:MAG: chlorophyllide a reductase subunit Z [Anaerolineales bacterium]|nr:chlorophyllide a reductase subunit Z [Anaerolineales bacterium]MCB9127105.1 chlorophyllide a reductase subunit Z [Ardenticatenales bacterium]